MFWRWFINFSLLILLVYPASGRAENKLPQLYQQLLPSIVTLHTYENQVIESKIVVVTDPNGLGSGVVVSDEGLIVTAAHVVHSVDALHVEFANGERRSATILSSLPWADLALVKVDDLPTEVIPAKLGDSDKVQVGEQVFVIGAPLGLSQTLTVGYISGIHLAGSEETAPLADFFQTDAAINPGNSGGPLFNMQGEIIGIASHIQTQSGGSDGLGFTVTSNTVSNLLLNRGYFWTGMELYPLNLEMSKALHLPQKNGVLVIKVASGSPAEQAGIRGGTVEAIFESGPVLLGGDVILSVNGISFNSHENLAKIIQSLLDIQANESVEFVVWRGGKRLKFVIRAT